MARHVHADAIHAWAEGAEVEYLDEETKCWKPVAQRFWVEYHSYRIANLKLHQHRLARMATQRSTEYFVVAQSNSDVLSIQANPDFIEWVR